MGAAFAELIGRLIDSPDLADPLRPYTDPNLVSELLNAVDAAAEPGDGGGWFGW